MRRGLSKRFLFNQVSGVVVAIATMLATILVVLGGLFRIFELDPNAPPTATFWVVLAVFFGALITIEAAALYLWRRVLISLGTLMPEEAEGYPFAKPWSRECVGGRLLRKHPRVTPVDVSCPVFPGVGRVRS